jgi:hypothetical protein
VVHRYRSTTDVFGGLEQGEANSLLINIFSDNVNDGVAAIDAVRNRFPDVPICLIGTNRELTTLPGIQGAWRTRFQHYFRLAYDDTPDVIRKNAELIVGDLASYLLASTASKKLRGLKNIISDTRDTSHFSPGSANAIQEAVDLAQRALEVRTTPGKQYILPGFEGAEVQTLVKSTLEAASSGLKRTAAVNIGILIVGAGLVVSSFIVAVSTGSWEAVSFGGFGVAGVVAALITNPLKSVGRGARQLVQIQIAYLGFINQLALLNRSTGEETQQFMLDRSKQLGDATTSMLAALEKHFG